MPNEAELLDILGLPAIQPHMALDTPKDGVQLKLRGIFTSLREGCPQYIDGKCSDREMAPCTYDQKPMQSCPVLAEVIKQWQTEYLPKNEHVKN